MCLGHKFCKTKLWHIYIYIQCFLCFYYLFQCMWWVLNLIYMCRKCLSKTWLANASINVFRFVETCWYLMKSKYLYKMKILKNIRSIVGLLIAYTLVNYSTTSCELSLITIWWIPWEITSDNSSITMIYSVMVFLEWLIQIPCKLTNSPFKAYIAHAAEERFRVLRLAPST